MVLIEYPLSLKTTNNICELHSRIQTGPENVFITPLTAIHNNSHLRSHVPETEGCDFATLSVRPEATAARGDKDSREETITSQPESEMDPEGLKADIISSQKA